jgi:signal transduction histidine kinase
VRSTVRRVIPEPRDTIAGADEMRRLVAPCALVVAIVAVLTDPGPAAGVALAAVPVAAFAWWAYADPPLGAVALAVLVPVVVAQRDGDLEPLLFEASLLALVVGRWSATPWTAAALGLLTAAAPVAIGLVQDPGDISVGVWILGIAFPWLIARTLARQWQLAAQLDETRQELARQALHAERRRIAGDVHDLVGHGLAAVMLQITSARHVLRRDADAAEEALRAAEDVGRRSMQELRRTVGLLRAEDDDASGVAPPLPTAADVPALVDEARAAGLAVEMRVRGDLSGIDPGVGVAVYRIAQEALANAARHAPRARTVVGLELAGERVCLTAETSGVTATADADPDRPRYGLIGMHERAAALGGEFAAGPTPDGWQLRCRLPAQASGGRA